MSEAATQAARGVCVVLHDVAPARWTGCSRVLAALEACAAEAGRPLPLTLLVVPHWHGSPAWPPACLHKLQRLQQQGHELALHGYTHRDAGPRPRHPLDWWRRRVYTASEGEFAALDEAQAFRRLRAGQRWAAAAGLHMPGFVAPAWLASPGCRAAVAAAGFTHTCTLTHIVALPEGRRTLAPSLVFSTRTAWRRHASRGWVQALAWAAQRSPLLRLDLHPSDADDAAVRRCWQRWLTQALRERQPLRLGDAAARARDGGSA